MLGTVTPSGAVSNATLVRRWTLAQKYNVDVTAADPNTSEDRMLDIVANGSEQHLALIAANRGITRKVAAAILARKPVNTVVQRLAGNPAVPGVVLDKLAERYGPEGENHRVIVSNLASNPALPVATIVSLLPDKAYQKDTWNKDTAPQKQAVMNLSVPVKELIESIKFLKESETKAAVVQRRGLHILQYLYTEHGTRLNKPTAMSIVEEIERLAL